MLRRARILADWPDATVQALANAAELWRYGKGERIVDRYDPASGLWLVVNGSLTSFRSSPSGRYMLCGLLWPGDVTGLVSILDGDVIPESAEARTDVLLVFMPRPALLEAMKDNRCLSSLAKAVCFRWRVASESTYLRITDSLRCQLAKLLCYLPRRSTLAMSMGAPGDPTWIDPAPMDVTQSEIAGLLGVARQTVNRVMKEFLRKRIVARDGESIRVINFRGLLAIVEEDEPAPPDWRAEILSWDDKLDNERPSGSSPSATASNRLPDSRSAR